MPIDRVEAPTKSEVAYTALRDAIRSGELVPGERLLLQDLARRLGMSLTPVRDALRMLAAHGLIEHRANYGAVVAEFTLERAEEIYRLRTVLEPLAAEMAAERATGPELDAMDQALLVLDQAVADSRENDVADLNYGFHRAVYAASGSEHLMDFIDRLWNGVPFQALSLAGRARSSSDQHRALMDALRGHDARAASDIMRAHITEAAEHTLRQIREHRAAGG